MISLRLLAMPNMAHSTLFAIAMMMTTTTMMVLLVMVVMVMMVMVVMMVMMRATIVLPPAHPTGKGKKVDMHPLKKSCSYQCIGSHIWDMV